MADLKNKLNTVIYGNAHRREFTFNKKIYITEGEYSYGGRYTIASEESYDPSDMAPRLYNAIKDVNLIEDVTIRPYTITIEIPEGFSEDFEEIFRVKNEVAAIICTILFDGEYVVEETVDLSDRYKQNSQLNY